MWLILIQVSDLPIPDYRDGYSMFLLMELEIKSSKGGFQLVWDEVGQAVCRGHPCFRAGSKRRAGRLGEGGLRTPWPHCPQGHQLQRLQRLGSRARLTGRSPSELLGRPPDARTVSVNDTPVKMRAAVTWILASERPSGRKVSFLGRRWNRGEEGKGWRESGPSCGARKEG